MQAVSGIRHQKSAFLRTAEGVRAVKQAVAEGPHEAAFPVKYADRALFAGGGHIQIVPYEIGAEAFMSLRFFRPFDPCGVDRESELSGFKKQAAV